MAAAAPPTDEAWTGPIRVHACTPEPLQLPGDTEKALSATLLVRAGDGIGSAVLVSPDGFALTAAHVVGPFDTVTVVTYAQERVDASVVRVDEQRDVALLKVSGLDTAPCLAPIGERAAIGSDVFVLGSPAGEELSFSVAKGIVSAHRDFGGASFVQLDASVNPGNSGGPAVDGDGRVVGLASWKVSHVSMEGLAFAVPIASALQALEMDFGDSSDANWAALAGRRSVEREPDAVPPPTLRPIDARTQRRQSVRRGLIASGIASLGAGTLMVAITGSIFLAAKTTGSGITTGRWRTLVGLNTTGWVLGGVGGALLIAGIAVRPRAKSNTALLPMPGGVALSQRF